jgi:hypothetical protein
VVCRFSQIGYKGLWECAANAILTGSVKRFSTSGVIAFLFGFFMAGMSNDALYDALFMEATAAKGLMFSQQYHW